MIPHFNIPSYLKTPIANRIFRSEPACPLAIHPKFRSLHRTCVRMLARSPRKRRRKHTDGLLEEATLLANPIYPKVPERGRVLTRAMLYSDNLKIRGLKEEKNRDNLETNAYVDIGRFGMAFKTAPSSWLGLHY